MAGRQLDAFRVFMERNAQLLRKNGFTGVVVPSAFHTNAGATGVRQLYLDKMALRCCFSFENRKQLFDIHRSFKFAVVVGLKNAASADGFECGFYLTETSVLFEPTGRMPYSLDFVQRTSPKYLTLFEIKNEKDLGAIQQITACQDRISEIFSDHSISLRRENYPSTPLPSGCPPIPIFEGKNFQRYDDAWDGGPTTWIDQGLASLNIAALGHYRLSYRRIQNAGNETTSIWILLSPPCAGADSSPIEQTPQLRPNCVALSMLAALNSTPFDFHLRLPVTANVSPFIVNNCRIPSCLARMPLLSHAALRLLSNHDGYKHLWHEQVGSEWRESAPALSWPVLGSEADRWQVRAAIDAVVADAYGLSRHQYEHILSTFSHASYPKVPYLCLEAFDELREIGIEAFCQKHDPYWDIPLNENLPQPVLDLEISGQNGIVQASLGPLFDSAAAAVAQAEIGVSTAPMVTAKPAPAQAPSVGPSGNGVFATLTELLCSRGVITSSDAQQATGLDAAGVRPHLQRLVSEGLAVTEGQRRGMKYRRVDG